MITCEQVRKLFNYCPDTGLLTYAFTKGRYLKNKQVGTLLTNGYFRTVISGHSFYVHRIAFLHYHNYIPLEIDHVNGVKTDNRITNLRECLRQGNEGNKKLKSHNTSGFKGVFKCRNKWQAKIANSHIGVYDTKIEAALAYDAAAIIYFGNFALTNKELGLL